MPFLGEMVHDLLFEGVYGFAVTLMSSSPLIIISGFMALKFLSLRGGVLSV